jgi:hypothetical protein
VCLQEVRLPATIRFSLKTVTDETLKTAPQAQRMHHYCYWIWLSCHGRDSGTMHLDPTYDAYAKTNGPSFFNATLTPDDDYFGPQHLIRSSTLAVVPKSAKIWWRYCERICGYNVYDTTRWPAPYVGTNSSQNESQSWTPHWLCVGIAMYEHIPRFGTCIKLDLATFQCAHLSARFHCKQYHNTASHFGF